MRMPCGSCGLDRAQHNAGRGVVSAAIFVLCPVIVALAFRAEFRFSPSLWVHILLWPLLTVPLAALQHRHRTTGMGL